MDHNHTARWEIPLIAVVCGVAAVRVFLFCALFPFYNNVDEQRHVDLVLKFSRGDWPSEPLVRFSPEAARLFALYGTYEFLHAPETLPGGSAPVPLWKRPPQDAERAVAAAANPWLVRNNTMAHGPPVYYMVAGLWDRLGASLGLEELDRLYWLRFLNIPLMAVLVWLAYLFCRDGFPARRDLRLGVPILLAFLPQDVFYSVNADVLSASLFALSLWLLLRWYRCDVPTLWSGIALGLLVAMTFLLKFTNIALPLVFGITVLLKLRQVWSRGRRGKGLAAVSTASLAAAVPVVVYVSRNVSLLNDWTGSRAKVADLGWTPRPFSDWFDHPLFTPAGFWQFWDGLMHTFWRGEFLWQLQPISFPAVDRFYSVSSVLFLVVAIAVPLVKRFRSSSQMADKSEKSAGGNAYVRVIVMLSVGISLSFLMLLSMSYDFGDCFYPSQEHPYFTSGRLISGALVPFLILYVEGASILFRPIPKGLGLPIFIGLMCLLMTASEVMLTRKVAASEYNFFHAENSELGRRLIGVGQ